jgi:hypothetical protein
VWERDGDFSRTAVNTAFPAVITIHSLTKRQQRLPKLVFHSVRSAILSFSFHYPRLFSISSSSCLLLPPLPHNSILLSMSCFRNLSKMLLTQSEIFPFEAQELTFYMRQY